MKFSERQGLVQVRTTLQTTSMSPELRASLWNVLHVLIWDRPGFLWDRFGHGGRVVDFAKTLWFIYFKRPFSDFALLVALCLLPPTVNPQPGRRLRCGERPLLETVAFVRRFGVVALIGGALVYALRTPEKD